MSNEVLCNVPRSTLGQGSFATVSKIDLEGNVVRCCCHACLCLFDNNAILQYALKEIQFEALLSVRPASYLVKSFCSEVTLQVNMLSDDRS
jgi:hypothetical protein